MRYRSILIATDAGVVSGREGEEENKGNVIRHGPHNYYLPRHLYEV